MHLLWVNENIVVSQGFLCAMELLKGWIHKGVNTIVEEIRLELGREFANIFVNTAIH